MLDFEKLINYTLCECNAYFSTPILHFKNGISMLIVTKLTNHSVQLSINVINNRKIDVIYYGAKGLNLKFSATNTISRSSRNVLKQK